MRPRAAGWIRSAGRLRRGIAEHPLAVVTAGAVAVGVVHGWWIWTHRSIGAFDPDEAGYLAEALRLRRVLGASGWSAAAAESTQVATAPLVPALSAVLLLVGPTDPRTAMMIQPILMVLATVCTSAMTLRLARPATAVLVGFVFLTVPSSLLATQSYWFGLAVAAFLSLSVLALLRSERGTNGWIWVFGLSSAAMVLSRTMAVAFVPALALGALVAVGRDRRGLLRLIAAGAMGAALAAPWYAATSSEVTGYLLTYGYGSPAGFFGWSSPLGRIAQRPLGLILDAGVLVPLGVLTAGIVTVLRRPAGLAVLRRSVDHRVLFAVSATGLLALMSTPNRGGWFTYPLLTTITPLAADLMEHAARPFRVAVASTAAALSVLFVLHSWWILPYGRPLPFPAHVEWPFAQYDDRFSPSSRDQHARAARDWERLNREVADDLRRLRRESGAVPTVSGNTLVFNSNSLALAAELQGWDLDPRVPDTTGGPAERRRWLTPRDWNDRGERVERVLVIADHEHPLFTPDSAVRAYAREARTAGWAVEARHDLPTGGSVAILRHR